MTSYYCVSNNSNIDTLRDYRNELIRNKEHLEYGRKLLRDLAAKEAGRSSLLASRCIYELRTFCKCLYEIHEISEC
jgi:hypothetical protein